MSDSLRLYRTIIEMLGNNKVRFHDKRCLITFARAIVGVLLKKSVHLSKWGMHRSGEARAASKQWQFARWLKNAKIVPSEIYKRLAQTAFADWGGHKIYLALDSSSLWDEFVLVRVALVYRGQALPLSWVILKQQSTMVAFEKYKRILKDAAAILPKGCLVILLADRGFDGNSTGYAYSNHHRNANFNRDRHTQPDSHGYEHLHANPVGYVYTNADRNDWTLANPYAYTRGDTGRRLADDQRGSI